MANIVVELIESPRSTANDTGREQIREDDRA